MEWNNLDCIKYFKKKFPLFFVILLFGSLFLNLGIIKSETIIMQGSDFNIYLSSGENLNFQHLATDYSEAFQITLSILSGSLNGSDGKITIWLNEGEMSFLSQDNATLQGEHILFIVNNNKFNEYANIENGDVVLLKWTNPYPLKPLLPIMFIIGMIGFGGLFGGPLYAIHKIKQKEYREGFINGVILTSIGVAFILAWLWS